MFAGSRHIHDALSVIAALIIGQNKKSKALENIIFHIHVNSSHTSYSRINSSCH